MKLEKIKITQNSGKYFDDMFDIYENSFPYFERRKRQEHLRAMQDEKFYCNGYIKNKILVAILFSWKMDEYSYIEHFAINKEYRNQNLGSNILSNFCKENDNVLLEIEPPVDEVTKRRLKFYEKHNFKFNDFFIMHPSLIKPKVPHKLNILTYNKFLKSSDIELFINFFKNTILSYSE